MSNIIAGTYKIEQKIGAGGGGTVYLGQHMRLGKQVVLKADKRTLSAKPEVLRREVDALKNLSHTYIPQVYDFVAEDDIVYTVMDYIQGESLDKPLNRGEHFEQAQVIRWACQLLDALQYLHNQPPYGILHGDLKPANVMLTPQGDIRLIDFNIALALGEEGAVQVGFSRGYASPEHYGIDYRSPSPQTAENAETQIDDIVQTILPGENSQSAGSTGLVRLDVRSDIYSLGATLYHLLSGVKPEQDAKSVAELDCPQVSQAVADIIRKAMSPNPDLRYQTAEEMLDAFQHLWENDSRTRRFKKSRNIVAAGLAVICLTGIGMSFVGLQQMERAQAAVAQEAQQSQQREQESREALALVQSATDAFRIGDKETAKKNALAALSKDSPYTSAAQRTLTQVLGVYDLTDGFKAHAVITLPGRAIKQVLSPNGRYAAVLTSGQVNVVELTFGQIVAQLPANASALSDMVFAGEDMLIYAGAEGLSAYSLSAQKTLWCIDSERGETVTLSGNGSIIAVTGGGSSLVRFYNAATGEKGESTGSVDWSPLAVKSPVNSIFADPMDDLFTLDDAGRYLAVSFENGGLSLMDKYDPENNIVILDESDYTYFEGGFWGGVLGVCAGNGVSAEFWAVEVQTGDLIATLSSNEAMHLAVCEDGFCLAQSNVLVRIDLKTGEQTELAYTQEGIHSFSHVPERTLVQTETGKLLFFDENAVLFDQHDISNDFVDIAGEYAALSGRDTQTLQILKLETYPEKVLSTYPEDYFHDEARVTNEGNILLYSAEGVRLYEPGGTLRGENNFDSIRDQIYDLQYRREGGAEYLEVLYDSNDTGISLCLSAQDLSVLSEEKIPLSDKTLYEEFKVGNYIVTSQLHEAPRVVNATTGETITELESDGYLTYVTAVGDGVITEYVTTDGTRYGLLLNEEWEPVADLPCLCDILPDETLVFDNVRGTLRQSKIYTLDELRELARQ